mgnify:CR=1 FL=1
MRNTYLIGKHLSLLPGNLMSEPCALCGAEPDGQLTGLFINDVLSDEFMDVECLSGTRSMCIYCAACIGKGQPQSECIRMTSFLATSVEFIRLKREAIWHYILNPPADVAFVFGVTYTHKKHISFKAPVNLPGQRPYRIRTENLSVDIHPERISGLMSIIQRWYSICKDVKEEPTWFTKEEIKHGCCNFKRIDQYGVTEYIEEDWIIRPYRRTALLELLCHAVNKGPMVTANGFFS